MPALAQSRFSQPETELLKALSADIRQPIQVLSEQLAISAPTVRRRIDKLHADHQELYLGPVVDIYAAGYQYVLILGVKTNQAPESIARQIAALNNTIAVNLVSGEHDIEAAVILHSHDEVSQLLFDTLAAIEGIEHIAPSLALDVWKFQGCQHDASRRAVTPKTILDDTDLAIIQCLKTKARQSNRKIAEHIDVTEATVRNRLKRMQQQKQLQLTGLALDEQAKHLQVAYLGIDVQGAMSAAVCKALSELPESNFVATTLGKHDIICCVQAHSEQALNDFIRNNIDTLTGVKSTSRSFPIANIKYDASLGIIL